MDLDTGLVRLADCSIDDLLANVEAIERGAKESGGPPNVSVWFLPQVNHALKGGVRTAFMLAEEFSARWGTLNCFVIYSFSGANFDVTGLANTVRQYFPKLRYTVQLHRRGLDDLGEVPNADVAFCTLWTTAYLLLKFNRTSKKFYLMQDFEPSFYAAGDVYGVIEQTYRFGFSCIANTPGVAEKFKRFSNDVISFLPGVDTNVYTRDTKKNTPERPFRVVFYGRPSNARNCFGLGIMTLSALKRKFKDQVEIISVGEKWREADYGLEAVISNWGLLNSLDEVARLYKSADLGLVFMTTPHPSYQPLEYMACGCVVATNINEANSWLLSGENALLLEPIPEIAAQKIHDLLKDVDRWRSLRGKGWETVNKLSWSSAFDVVLKRVNEGGA